MIERPLGHATTIERLWGAARENRLPHALLFEGEEGTGKFVAARWFANGLLCAAGPAAPCLVCGPCKRVLSGNHADLFVIDPLADEEEQIRVHRIAVRSASSSDKADPEGCLESFLGLRALEGGSRPVLLRESHRMNAAAQNALLKTLEEPRPGTLLVLETHRPDLLLPTILSRCVRVRMGSLSPEECARVLLAHGLDAEVARRLTRWSAGSPGRALRMHARAAEDMRALVAEALIQGVLPHRLVARLWELDGDFVGKTPLAKSRDRARAFLDLALDVLRDVVRRRQGLPAEGLPHGDLAEEALRAGRPRGDATERLEAVLACRADVDSNLGPEAVVERALWAVQDGIVSGSSVE